MRVLLIWCKVFHPLSTYACATRCPVLTWHMLPCTAYALATRCPVLTWRMMLSVYVLAMRCPVLKWRVLLPELSVRNAKLEEDNAGHVSFYVLCDVRYFLVYYAMSGVCYAMSGTDIAHGPTSPSRQDHGYCTRRVLGGARY
eukprot:1051884-Rhodomonas_salina.2